MIDKIIEDLGEGITRVNLDPDRWYEFEDKHYPSVTWILQSYPKDIGFNIWLSKLKDWDEGQRILRKAGDRGSRVHTGIEKLLRRETLKYDDIMPGHPDPFTSEDWTYLLSFLNFHEDYPLTVLNLEEIVIKQNPNFGGTADFRGYITSLHDDEEFVLDWKTSSAIYPTHYMQIAAYARALRCRHAGILRLGTKHKKAYEFKMIDGDEIDYHYELFKNVYAIWQDQNQGAEPRYKTFKSEIKLEVEDVEKNDEKKDNSRREGKNKNRDEGEKQGRERNTEEPRLL